MIEAVPDFVGSSVLVAVTVTFAAAEGAVKIPVEAMEPPPATDQVTAEVKLPVPWTLAAHWEVAPVATVVGEHDGETEEMAGEVACGGRAAPAVPPQETTHESATQERTGQTSRAQRRQVFKEVLRLLLGHTQAGQ